MKKKIAFIIMLISMVFFLVGCSDSPTTESFKFNSNDDYFITIQDCGDYTMDGWSANIYIAYAKDTHVKYLIGVGPKKSMITPLYNTDGTLQIYEGE